MEIVILFLALSFGAGFFVRGQRAKTDAEYAQRHADGLERQNGLLRQEIERLRGVDSKRQAESQRRKQFFKRNDISDIENQIRFIRQADLRAVKPVNREAVSVLYALDKWIDTHRDGWRLAFEVSMGAFIRTAYDPNDRLQRAAFSSYNSKRVDFLLIDRYGHPVLAVEYHGTGHDLSEDAADRMEVKRLALKRAGIPLVEIPARADQAAIQRLVSDTLAVDGRHQGPSGPQTRVSA